MVSKGHKIYQKAAAGHPKSSESAVTADIPIVTSDWVREEIALRPITTKADCTNVQTNFPPGLVETASEAIKFLVEVDAWYGIVRGGGSGSTTPDVPPAPGADTKGQSS